MIPRLPPGEPVRDAYLAFLDALPAGGFGGDVRVDHAARLVHATDNSVYQWLPQAVIAPRSADDVVAVMRLLAEPRFADVHLAPRGGGTGTNGQSLTDGLVLDLSRHLNQILEVNLAEGFARVQPGVVLDQLNDHLRPHGVFFAPDLSPSSRATIGGMISTDAAGKGSRIYGKTSEHILALTTVFSDGTVFTSSPVDEAEAAALAGRNDRVGDIHRELLRVTDERADLIAQVFPKLRRFMTGYNLARVRRDGRFDLNALLAGAEGTLGVLVEARVRLTPIPTCARLVLLKYARFEDALGSAELLVASDPAAIETIDEMVLGLARRDIIWRDVRAAIGEDSASVRAINLVEFTGTDPAVVDAQVDALLASMADHGAPYRPLGHHVARDDAERAALWALRKKGVGLLGNAEGPRKPVPFVEDTVVPPVNLRAYIAEFRALLDAEGLTYGMFGHIDVGCLHVRPALDLTDPDDEARLRRISDGVCALVQKYGGVIWGEHGRGFRSEYGPRFFGETLYAELRRVKAAFDPKNQLNPGKLATPAGSDAALVSIDDAKRGAFDRQIPAEVRARFAPAVHCNGNGACFDYHPDHLMCPSSRATRDRVHSPKGRAGVMREWLRLLAAAGHTPDPEARPASFARRAVATLRGGDDYSHAVYEAMNGCLACKACTTQCPIRVDVPTFRADFFALYHTRYLRPLRDHLIAGLERAAALGARFPRFANALARFGPARAVLRRVGIVDAPALTVESVAAGLAARRVPRFDLKRLQALSPGEKASSVIVLQDAFTSFFDSRALLATYDLLTALGLSVHIAPFFENGKGLHIRGFTRRFRRLAARNAERLRALAAPGVPLIGIEPAVVLTYRDEYPHALGVAPDALGFSVQMLQEWLQGHLDRLRAHATPGEAPYALLAHCTERALAPGAPADWRRVFQAVGLDLHNEAVGCCGMCGVFGHEAQHAEESRALFAQSWARALDRVPAGRALADGFSCRSQVERCGAPPVRHPAEVLRDHLAARTR
ncbi:MAG: FAD-binding oxidoreductase [Myxococcales bacterium]|nr:FAD-binding oxidoreductase [Myxococcales bacterium]